MDLVLFLTFALIAVACGLNMALQRHPVSSALSLIGVMVSLAVLYVLLGAECIAAAQLVVYSGAIMVLFLFVIMLLNAGAEKLTKKAGTAHFLGLPLLLILLAALLLRALLIAALACLTRLLAGLTGLLAGLATLATRLLVLLALLALSPSPG